MNKTCQICSINESTEVKYKCPTCYIKYCSLECWKEHQKIECCKPDLVISNTNEKDSSITLQPFLAPTDDTVPPDCLEKLKDSEKLRSLLKNMELRQMILEIDRSRNVKKAIEDAMHSDHFVAFADACLEVVEEQEL